MGVAGQAASRRLTEVIPARLTPKIQGLERLALVRCNRARAQGREPPILVGFVKRRIGNPLEIQAPLPCLQVGDIPRATHHHSTRPVLWLSMVPASLMRCMYALHELHRKREVGSNQTVQCPVGVRQGRRIGG